MKSSIGCAAGDHEMSPSYTHYNFMVSIVLEECDTFLTETSHGTDRG